MSILHAVVPLPAIVFLAATLCIGQTPAREPTASISGHVEINEKSAEGITVVAALKISFFDNKTVAKTTTDEEGNYKLTGLPAGHFKVIPMAKAFLMQTAGAYHQPGQEVNVAEGEAVTKIDFTLFRGGVITGRITDAEGHPVIGERVSVVAKDGKPGTREMSMFGGGRNQTDDRGIYRVYGLGPGSYQVSVGQAPGTGGAVSIMGMGGSHYVKTFYPGVLEESKATPIEIEEGTEVTNIDISVGKSGSGFSVSGRVIDAESGQPIASAYIGHSSVNESDKSGGGMNFTGTQSDANGKYRLEGLQPGRYTVSTFPSGADNSTYSEPAPFEISDRDVTGIEIKLRRGATISGFAVVESNSDPAVGALLRAITLTAYVETKGKGALSYSSGQIGADGSFRLAGIAPGKARIWTSGFPELPKGLSLVRTEHDGLEQPDGIEITAGSNITGVRVVFAYGTGSIRGEVKIEGGTLPDKATLQLSIRSASGANTGFNRSIEIDARNRFVIENIAPGDYELTLGATGSNSDEVTSIQPVKRTVTVSNGAEVQVNLVYDVGKKGSQE
ncbi:MAG: carboxypeptidase regulatory-like domain-containing protein [Pyrinomonadaceae bacterium]|nr:carboxypeptidase regulatory-like domain-containing protein [Pyrinomonadaceae bacterium]